MTLPTSAFAGVPLKVRVAASNVSQAGSAPALLTIQAFLKPGGTLLNFTAMAEPPSPPPPLRLRAVHTLIAENQSRLAVLLKQRIG